MVTLKSFEVVLQKRVASEDRRWEYEVPTLPHNHATNNAKLVKSITLPSSAPFNQGIRLRFVDAPSNRVTWSEPLDRFVLLSVEGFKFETLPAAIDRPAQFSTFRESAEYVCELLVSGISINGVAYYFFGHSNSQLKSRSCFLYAAPKAEISKKIESMGDFSKLKSVSKKAKRIGLLFSSAEMGTTLAPERYEDIEDVERGDYKFTDGCGLISRGLAKQLVKQRNIAYRNKRYSPSVFQIRYRGYKGVLTLEPTLKGSTAVQFRKSMRKFQDARDLTLSVVDYSRPYAFGYLNDEIVILLHALGISSRALLEKQSEYFNLLHLAINGQLRETFCFLAFCNRLDLAEKLLLEGFGAIRSTLRSLVKQEHGKMINKRDEQRCRILITKSRLLFGVCDPNARREHKPVLKEGCCFVRITNEGDGEARTLIGTEVLVTRNPCLHPGDLQKFRVVDVPEFSHLVDCIVFPTQGKRPTADLMSGGDLDGDKFFVTWDQDIIPSTISEPAEYPGVKEPISFKPISDDDRAIYFAKYTNASLGRVKNLYLKWARLKGSMSSECQQLNRLFSQCVDGNRIKVPPSLEDPPEPHCGAEQFILDVLHDAAKENIVNIMNESSNFDDDPYEMLDFLLTGDRTAMSEFELIQFTLRWCDRYDTEFTEFMNDFDYSKLSDEQQAWLLSKLPPSPKAPSLIRNALLQSRLVDLVELRQFKLDHSSLHWRLAFDSSTDRMARFFEVTCRALETYNRKLIILSVDERLTIMIYVPQRIEKANETQVDGSIRVFALPHSSGTTSLKYSVVPTKKNYRLYYDESVFQLYENKRANTWIFLNKGAMKDDHYRNIQREGQRRKAKQETLEEGVNFDCRASIALQKINAAIQKHVGRLNRAGILGAEIYVITNRDTQALRVLDLWLQYIDTQEVLPLFEQTPTDYSIPQLQSLNLEESSSLVSQIIRSKDVTKLRLLDSVHEVGECLQLLKSCGEAVLLREAYTRLLNPSSDVPPLINMSDLCRCLINFLPKAPYLIDVVFQSSTWASQKTEMQLDFEHIATSLIEQLILSANTIGHLIRQPLRMLLQELKVMPVQSLATVVELVALSVRDADTALNILLEIIEPETSRLLVGHPRAMNLCVKGLIGTALDHIDEAASTKKAPGEPLRLELDDGGTCHTVVKAAIRVDSPLNGLLKQNDHVRLRVPNPPQNQPLAKPFSMDALVVKSEPGEATFRCIHDPPSYFRDCVWELYHCGSFVTTKTMFDALSTFYSSKAQSCYLYDALVGIAHHDSPVVTRDGPGFSCSTHKNLNPSQQRALEAAMANPLTFLWGPPGTGKTHTIVAILVELLNAFPNMRMLVAAPTHNAVDNILQKFITSNGIKSAGVNTLRVSTSVNKVAPALRSFTCDAMVGKDLNANQAARRAAQKRVSESRLIFTTCAGAGLGLLRDENFEIVLIDEASQQTEPETLIPLVKGCRRAVFVGDHVQLRATVQKTAVIVGFDVSLFERHYHQHDIPTTRPGTAKVMLDTQYRMHEDICAFSSAEFYDGNLKTAVLEHTRPLKSITRFPWPVAAGRRRSRMLFVPCSATEDIGHHSKANRGQAVLCKKICELLCSQADTTVQPANNNNNSSSNSNSSPYTPADIAILTPYARQVETLKTLLASAGQHEISSIDGFQGREAEIVVFSTVRCNVHCELGFLTDMRRLNVAMTRARSAVVLVGDRRTLVGTAAPGQDVDGAKRCWGRLLGGCVEVEVGGLEGG